MVKYYRIENNALLTLLGSINGIGSIDSSISVAISPAQPDLLAARVHDGPFQGIKLIRFDGANLSVVSSINSWPAMMRFGPGGNYLYLFEYIMGGIVATGSTITAYALQPDLSFSQHSQTSINYPLADGDFYGNIFVGKYYGNLARFRLASPASWQYMDHILMSSGGFALKVTTNGSIFTLTNEDASNQSLQVYSRATDPTLSLLHSKEIGPNEIHWGNLEQYSFAVEERHETNLPPQVQMGDPQWLHFQSGVPVSLNAHGYAWDPDAGQCHADASNFVTSWEIVSVPGGSAITTASIVNPDSLTGAYFIPDVPGEYEVRLSFTDHPGSCQGSPQTAVGQIKLKIGYEHKTRHWCYEDPGTEPHAVGAQWNAGPYYGNPWWQEYPHIAGFNYKYHVYSSIYGVDPNSLNCYWGNPADCARDHGEMLLGDWLDFLKKEGDQGRRHISYPAYISRVPIQCGYWHWWDYNP